MHLDEDTILFLEKKVLKSEVHYERIVGERSWNVFHIDTVFTRIHSSRRFNRSTNHSFDDSIIGNVYAPGLIRFMTNDQIYDN